MLLAQAIQEINKLREEVEGYEVWLEQDTKKTIDIYKNDSEVEIIINNLQWN